MRNQSLNRRFSSSTLKNLIEDRCAAHVKIFNNNRNIAELDAGDIFMVRTTVLNDASKNKVAKLNYQVHGPFGIIKGTGRGSYLVRKLFKPDNPELKFKATDLYPLPHSLKPCEPVDTSDTRYLNQSYFPITNPLRKPLKIELYNETWFDKPPQIFQPLFDYNYPTQNFPTSSLTPFTFLYDLNAETKAISPPLLIKTFDTDIVSPPSPVFLAKPLSISNGFFSFVTSRKILSNSDGSLFRLTMRIPLP